METRTTPAAIARIHARDDVAVALRALEPGAWIHCGETEIVVSAPVRVGHKVALRSLKAGAPIHKYGWAIGRASADIEAGSSVHTHNLESLLVGEERYEFKPGPSPSAIRAETGGDGQAPTFQGYRRADG